MEIQNRVWSYWRNSTIVLLVLLCGIVIIDKEFLFLLLNRISSFLPDHFWGLVTNVGDGFVAALVPLFFARKRPDMLRAFLWATVIAIPFVQGMKFMVAAVRPGFIVSGTNVIGHLPSSWSFPSGHTATVAVIFGIIWMMSDKKWVRWSALILLLLGGFSRISVGVHWPVDVVVGLIIGLSAAAAGVFLTKDNRSGTIWSNFAVLFLTVACYNFITSHHLTPSYPLLRQLYGTVALIFGVTTLISELKRSRVWKK